MSSAKPITNESPLNPSHLRISYKISPTRAEIMLLATSPGQAWFANKWPRESLIIEQLPLDKSAQVMYWVRPRRKGEIGHGWCHHDVREWPCRIRHARKAGTEFYDASQYAVHHSLTFPVRIRESSNLVELVMPALRSEVAKALLSRPGTATLKLKFAIANVVILIGGHTRMVVSHVSRTGDVRCEWTTKADCATTAIYHQDILELAPTQKK